MSRSGRIALAFAFLAYCTLVIAGAVAHEPWWDEAQAWLIARDAPLPELFTRVVRYEGHPPLWHLLLAIPAKLGLPYWSLKVAGVLGGVATAWLLLYAFPRLPIPIRLLAPFTFFIAYQNTIVARSYVLLAPLLLLIAKMWDERSARPVRFALLLILLSNVSVHGFAIACGLALLFLIEVIGRRTPLPPKRAFAIGGAAFALNGILLVLMLWPPTDNPAYVHVHSPLDPHRHSQVVSTIVPALLWPPTVDETPAEAVMMAGSALIVVAVLFFWLYRSGAGAPFAMATLGAYGVALVYFSPWHEGIFFVVILFGAVLAFQRGGAGRWLELAATIVLVILFARHVEWSARSVAYDLRNEFTGSRRAAEFIRAHRLHERVMYGTGFQIVELQPYFETNVFDNYTLGGRAYWDWSSRNPWPYPQYKKPNIERMKRFMDRILADRPEVIVYAGGLLDAKFYAPRLYVNPQYRRVASFGGYLYWKDAKPWHLTYHVFLRRDIPLGSAPRTAAR